MWMWSLPWPDRPWRTATHRHGAFPSDPENPSASITAWAASVHWVSVSWPSSALTESEQCHT
jgi:hypothetical protein